MADYDINELKRRMQGALAVLKTELGGLRTGRASAHLLDPIHVEAYGQTCRSISSPPSACRSRA